MFRDIELKTGVDQADRMLEGAATTYEEGGWRWTVVGGVVALDNKPALHAADKLDRAPIYYSAVVPLDTLHQIVERAS